MEDTSNQVGTKIVFSIQVKDTIWGWTSNSQIQTIEWLGTNHIDSIYSDTAWNLRLNLNSDQTSFKVNNSMGVDTITFKYSWEPATFSTYCSSKYGKMQRFFDNLSVSSSRGKISVVKKDDFFNKFQNCVLILN